MVARLHACSVPEPSKVEFLGSFHALFEVPKSQTLGWKCIPETLSLLCQRTINPHAANAWNVGVQIWGC